MNDLMFDTFDGARTAYSSQWKEKTIVKCKHFETSLHYLLCGVAKILVLLLLITFFMNCTYTIGYAQL